MQGGFAGDVSEGRAYRVRGRWVERMAATAGQDPLRAGVLLARSVEAMQVNEPGAPGGGVAARLARLRAAGVTRVQGRFRREAPLVAALLFARRDALDPALRDAFAATGTAHLLAISGFHVGVAAGVVIWLLGRVVAPARAFAGGAALAWFYVLVLGLPDAATRAALLLTLAVVGRISGRPVSLAGALGTALIALVVVDPGIAGRVGAQLSFAGAFGLAIWARPWTEAVAERWRRRTGVPPARWVRGALEGGAVTAAATLATLPLVAWHFERVALVGMPASMGATPLVAVALPTVLGALVLDALHLPGAGLLATGAEGLLAGVRIWVEFWASLPAASLDVARPDLGAAAVGAVVGWAIIGRHRQVGGAVRALVVTAGVAAAGLAWPISQQLFRNGSLEVHMFDVGQGDALAVRTPRGRWLVIDAGPPTGTRLVRDLRRQGARRVALFLLSHPDADHVGGAAALIAALEPAAIAGPGSVRGEGPWRDAVRVAGSRQLPWRVLGAGETFQVDGVGVRVLWPPAHGVAVRADPNAASLVLEVSWQGSTLLFTGDAPIETETALAGDIGPLDVLKVGHHGSGTSTGAALLEETGPAIALVSVGRGNRYGHPDRAVLERLVRAGAEVWRTDTDGHVVVRVGRSGRIEVEGRR